MELAKVVNGTIELPSSLARWLGQNDELAVFAQGDTLILKKILPPRLTEFAARAPDDEPLPMSDIVAEVKRVRRASKRARRA
jgi:hypothetical protein